MTTTLIIEVVEIEDNNVEVNKDFLFVKNDKRTSKCEM
jgi:hypothetical protein